MMGAGVGFVAPISGHIVYRRQTPFFPINSKYISLEQFNPTPDPLIEFKFVNNITPSAPTTLSATNQLWGGGWRLLFLHDMSSCHVVEQLEFLFCISDGCSHPEHFLLNSRIGHLRVPPKFFFLSWFSSLSRPPLVKHEC